MLSRVEKVLLVVWVLPLVFGVVAGWHTARSPGDEGGIMLAMTGLVAAMYIGLLVSMVRRARRRARLVDDQDGAAGVGDEVEEVDADFIEGRVFHRGHGYIDTPRARGRAYLGVQSLSLFVFIPAAIYFLITRGDWFLAVIVVHVITLLTMSVYINERDTEDDPAK